MIIGMGTDIVEVDRVEKIFEKNGAHFAECILTAREIALLNGRKKGRGEFLAGRWAAKEAFSKALGTGMCEACAFKEIEILPDPAGAPAVTELFAQTRETFQKAGIKKIHLSISHERHYAVATVILEA